jgi:hypothetical protein
MMMLSTWLNHIFGWANKERDYLLQTIFFSLKFLDAVVSNPHKNDDKEDNDNLVEDGVNDNAEEQINTEEECRAALNKV